VRPKNKISGQFSYRTIEMMESPAFQVLSLAGHRILARVELELAHHGGNDNGRLPVNYDHFEEYGVHRHSIAAGLREVCALGFLEITQRGRAGNAEWRKPHYFRLTYRPVGNAKPTDDWRHIRTIEDAEAIAEHARRGTVRKKNKTPVAVSASFQCGKRTKESGFHSAESATTSHSAESTTTSIFSGRTEPARWVPCAGQNLAHLRHSHDGAMVRVMNPIHDRLCHLKRQRWSAPPAKRSA
jgi:hypothetical protein